jgi:hypothetical protein
MADKTGMKHRDFKPCAACGDGMMKNGLTFYRVRIERMLADPGAIRRAHGLELMIGDALVANVMGPDEDLAILFDGPHDILLCEHCAIGRPGGIGGLVETINERAAKAESADG